jgi:hypothetical protein
MLGTWGLHQQEALSHNNHGTDLYCDASTGQSKLRDMYAASKDEIELRVLIDCSGKMILRNQPLPKLRSDSQHSM